MDTERESPKNSAHAAQNASRIAVMTVNPNLLHIYWHISDRDLEALEGSLGESRTEARTLLRFYDITCILFDGTNAHRIFDVEVDFQSMRWNVPIWSADKTYLVDLGYQTSDGRFRQIARSNMVRVPRNNPSPRITERYLRVEGDLVKGLASVRVARGVSRSSVEEPAGERMHGVRKDTGNSLEQKSDRAKEPDSTRIRDGLREVRMDPGPVSRTPVPERQPHSGDHADAFDLVQMTEERFRFGESSPAVTRVTNS